MLANTALLRLDDALLDEAAAIDHGVLRSLDAIHVAAALALGEELECLVTYDERMRGVAESLAIAVQAPA